MTKAVIRLILPVYIDFDIPYPTTAAANSKEPPLEAPADNFGKLKLFFSAI